MNETHEGLAIDAVIRAIEKRDGVSRSDERDPEKEKHDWPVDFVCKLGTTLYAIEHTVVEAYPGQLRHNEHASRFIGAISEKLRGIAEQTEAVQLMFPIDATDLLNRQSISAAQDAIVEYVKVEAPKLEAIPYGSFGEPHEARIKDVPFPVSLRRYSDVRGLGGTFHVVRLAKHDLSLPRSERLRIACEKKYEKLSKWQAQGAKAVLILEDIDIALTNEQLVFEALTTAENDLAWKPDEVYSVNASIKSPWYVTCLRCHGKTYYDDGERFLEVNPTHLTDLTKR